MARSKRSVENEEFWRLVLNEHAASGLSIKAFCKREAVSEASFYFWRRELAIRDEQSGQTPNSSAIIPVRVVDSESCHPQADLTDGDQPVQAWSKSSFLAGLLYGPTRRRTPSMLPLGS